jgi:hypothetical protein
LAPVFVIECRGVFETAPTEASVVYVIGKQTLHHRILPISLTPSPTKHITAG